MGDDMFAEIGDKRDIGKTDIALKINKTILLVDSYGSAIVVNDKNQI